MIIERMSLDIQHVLMQNENKLMYYLSVTKNDNNCQIRMLLN